jgi:hypothetical protein
MVVRIACLLESHVHVLLVKRRPKKQPTKRIDKSTPQRVN